MNHVFEESIASLLAPPTKGTTTQSGTEAPSPVTVCFKPPVAQGPVPVKLVAGAAPVRPFAMEAVPARVVVPERTEHDLAEPPLPE